MHSTDYKSVTFLHNGDYSGDVIVVLPAETSEMELDHQSHTVSVKVPYKALEYLVSSKVSTTLVSQLEDVESFQDILEVFGFRNKKLDEARFGFIRTLASLDNTSMSQNRRMITLQDIIDQAKELLG